MASFEVDFLGCKVSHVDARDVRERLLADGHEERRGGAAIAVISTCCVTREAVSKSRKAAARAARTHRRVYLTGCAANLGGAFEGLPENVVVPKRLTSQQRELLDDFERLSTEETYRPDEGFFEKLKSAFR